MKTKYKFIEFIEKANGGYEIWNHRYKENLGSLHFHIEWNEWELHPDSYTAWSGSCLIDVLDFIKQLKDRKNDTKISPSR